MLAMGIDPGHAICGYGLVESQGSRLVPVHYGAVTTESVLPMAKRLQLISYELERLVKFYKPQITGIEQLFFNKNIRTAIAVAQARGVIMLTMAQNDIDIVEYTPLQVKQAVVGYGKATKEQVMYMTQKLLSLTEKPKPDDAADALAVAICTLHSSGSDRMRGWQR